MVTLFSSSVGRRQRTGMAMAILSTLLGGREMPVAISLDLPKIGRHGTWSHPSPSQEGQGKGGV